MPLIPRREWEGYDSNSGKHDQCIDGADNNERRLQLPVGMMQSLQGELALVANADLLYNSVRLLARKYDFMLEI